MKIPLLKKSHDDRSNPVKEDTALQPVERESLPVLLKKWTSPKSVAAYVKDSFPLWFDSEKPHKSEKRFPLSYFASLIVIAVCLFLIVSGNMMLTSAKTEQANLENRIKKMETSVAQAQTDLEADLDLLVIREIAVDEYKMVSEEYLKNEYLSTEKKNKIETFDEKSREFSGLFDWLKALGFR